MVFETAIALIAIFTVLVAFHEMGHLLVARACGMRVEEFSIGFGPIFARLGKRGSTEYNARIVPLGGFVRIAGQEPGQEDIADGFQAQAAWKRALVVFAGPFSSALLAVITFVLLGVIWGFPTGTTTNRVINVFPQSEAARLGIRTGDRVLSVDSTPVGNGQDLVSVIHSSAGKEVNIQIDRRGETLTVTGVPEYNISAGGYVWSFEDSGAVVKDMIAERKKDSIQTKDKLVSVNGVAVKTGQEFEKLLSAQAGEPLEVVVEREGKNISQTIQHSIAWIEFAKVKWGFPGPVALFEATDKSNPGLIKAGDELVSINGTKIKSGTQMLQLLNKAKPPLNLRVRAESKMRTVQIASVDDLQSGNYMTVGLLGFALEPRLQREGFIKSISKGFELTTNAAVSIVTTLSSSKVKDDIGGPLMIGKITNSAVKLGPYWVIVTLGSLSISLAVINLLPIPLLDGGVLAVLLIESIRRRRLSIREQNAVAALGLVIIGLIVVSVLYMDILKLVKGLVPQ